MGELLIVGGVCLGVSCVICGFIGKLILGNSVYGVAIGFLVGGGLIYLSCSMLQKLRRGQEIGYFSQLFLLKLHEQGFNSESQVIRRDGSWMVGRDVD